MSYVFYRRVLLCVKLSSVFLGSSVSSSSVHVVCYGLPQCPSVFLGLQPFSFWFPLPFGEEFAYV